MLQTAALLRVQHNFEPVSPKPQLRENSPPCSCRVRSQQTSLEKDSCIAKMFVSNNELPCTVVVTRGYSHGVADEEESISNGEVITLHSVQDVQIVQAVDHLGRDCTLPVVNCDSKFKILPKDANLDGKIYETLHDMIKDPHMPKKVRVTAAVDSGDEENTIYTDDILELITLFGNSQSGSGDQRCIVMKNQLDESLKLPLSTPGKFSTQLDTKWYSMVEILDQCELPVRVQQVNATPSLSSSSATHNKFCLMRKEVESSVLATVNKELIYLPKHCEAEVSPLQSPTSTPQPAITITVNDSNLTELPPPVSDVSDDRDIEQALADTDRTSTSSRKSSFGDNFTGLGAVLSAKDKEMIRVGSIRRFGSSSNIAQEEGSTEDDARPQRAMELFEQLQEKTAECIRLQEWSNKWQAKCQRLDSQTQNMRKSADETERRSMFWRQQVQKTTPIDEEMLQKLEAFRKSGDKKILKPAGSDDDDNFRPFSPLVGGSTFSNKFSPSTGKKPSPAVAKKPVKKLPDVQASTLTIDNMQMILKALNMSQYGEQFLEEQVDGGLLLDLPEDAIKTDLGMTNLLHRKKLLRTLRGQGPMSLRDLLAGKVPHV